MREAAKVIWRYWPWLLVGMVVLLSITIRFRLREMPMERDEGEYAYAGQLMLQGIPPYKFAYNMKLPGTYASYAASLALFGQTPAGARLGLVLINAASIVLVFLLGRKLLDDAAGVAAATVFALAALSISMLGLAAHATHFVVLPALGGTLLLVDYCEKRRASFLERPSFGGRGRSGRERERRWSASEAVPIAKARLFAGGLLLGLSFLMKQHGILYAVCAAMYLGWVWHQEGLLNWSRLGKELGIFALGCLVPYVTMVALLALAGVYREFVFWTFTYATKYVSAVPASDAPGQLRLIIAHILSENPYFWIIGALGAVVMWWEERLNGRQVFIVLFLLCSAVAVSAGFYFRGHYFIQFLPALAVLCGVAVSRSIHVLRHHKTLELFLAVPILILMLLGIGGAFVSSGAIWFAVPPENATQRIYGSTLFKDCARAAEHIKAHTTSEDKVAVIGSEPEIYFLSKRRSATGYIYVYALMESHDFALKMQEEMISQIETNRPKYVVLVRENTSWLRRSNSEGKIFTWWENYSPANYEVDLTLNISKEKLSSGIPGNELDVQDYPGGPELGGYLLVYKRKD